MRIDANNHSKYQKPSFQAYDRVVYDKCKFKCRTTTSFFRNDLDWEKFISYIQSKFKNTNKVNVINHACSDGEETYSLALKLLELENGEEKFFPICAKDLYMFNIQKAKRGIFQVLYEEIAKIKENIKKPFESYFIQKENLPTNPSIYDARPYTLCAQKDLKQKIQFSQADILQDVNNIPRKNTLLLCRNFWPYLDYKQAEKLATNLGKRLKFSSVIVIGNYEKMNGIPKMLKRAGFRHTDIENVMEKIPQFQYYLQRFFNLLDIRQLFL